MRYFADYIKGKPYERVVLWENSSPSSAFSAQTITLEDDITNYDQLEIQWCLNTSNLDNKRSIIVHVTEFIASGANDAVSCKSMLAQYNGSINTIRVVYYVTNTSVGVTASYRVASSGSETTNCVPLKIIGIKKGLNEFKFKKGTLTWSEFTETGASGEHKIEIGFRPKKIIWYFPNTCFLDTYYEEVSTTYFVGNTLITSGNYSWQKLGLKAGQNPWLLNLQSVDDTGFTLGYKDYQDWSSRTLFWEAWG